MRDSRFVMIADGPDVMASLEPLPTKDAVRGEIIVAREFLQQHAKEAMAHVTLKLAERIAWECEADVHKVVTDYLLNREWSEPIIRKAIQSSVREWMREILESSPIAEAMRRRDDTTETDHA